MVKGAKEEARLFAALEPPRTCVDTTKNSLFLFRISRTLVPLSSRTGSTHLCWFSCCCCAERQARRGGREKKSLQLPSHRMKMTSALYWIIRTCKLLQTTIRWQTLSIPFNMWYSFSHNILSLPCVSIPTSWVRSLSRIMLLQQRKAVEESGAPLLSFFLSYSSSNRTKLYVSFKSSPRKSSKVFTCYISSSKLAFDVRVSGIVSF